MKIRFFDKETGKDAILGKESLEFYIDKDGNVLEFEYQEHGGYYVHSLMPDIDWQIVVTPEEIRARARMEND